MQLICHTHEMLVKQLYYNKYCLLSISYNIYMDRIFHNLQYIEPQNVNNVSIRHLILA